jgi:hypothetical protein
MRNAWLDVPLADYEGHMSAPGVEQLGVLSDLFRHVLHETEPASVAILGVAGGNGLEHIDRAITRRVVGIDVNADYARAAAERFTTLPGLEIVVIDLEAVPPAVAPCDLVHAALLFEHTGTGRCLEHALGLVAPGGTFSVVLQGQSTSSPGVAATPFTSMHRLRDGFALVDREDFVGRLAGQGWRLMVEGQRVLPGGKAFWAATFARR